MKEIDDTAGHGSTRTHYTIDREDLQQETPPVYIARAIDVHAYDEYNHNYD